MNEEIDSQDRERKLVKMTSDEFADGFNKAARGTVQEWFNREWLLLAIVLLCVVGVSLYWYFAGQR